MIKRLLHSSLVKSTSIYTLSTFINSGIPFLLLPILTRYLTTEEYGQLSMFNATATFLLPFIGLSISSGIERKLADGSEAESKEYIFNCLLIFAAAILVCSLIITAFSDIICRYIAIPKLLIPHIIIFAASTCLCNVVLSYFQIKEMCCSYAVFQNACSALNVGLSILLVVKCGMSFKGRIYGISLSKLVFAVIAFIFVCRYIRGNRNKFNRAFIRDELLNFALPLIPIEIKSVILTYTDRIFLTNMINVATTGVYSLGNQISLPILFFEQAFNLAFLPWLYKKLKENRGSEKRKIVKITYLYSITVLLTAIFWSIFTKPFMAFISGPGYEDAHQYVIWLSLGYAFTGMHMMVVNYIYYVKKLNLYTVVSIAVMVLNVVLNGVLIDQHGSIGAAEATMICNCLSFVFTWILSIKICPMPWFSFWKHP